MVLHILRGNHPGDGRRKSELAFYGVLIMKWINICEHVLVFLIRSVIDKIVLPNNKYSKTKSNLFV